MDKESKKKLEKRLTIGFQVFALIGLVIIGFYLGKAYKARKNNTIENETIKDFGTKLEEFNIDSNTKKYNIKLDGKSIDIENKDDGVYLNNKKTSLIYAMGGYTLDKVLILYNVSQNGYKLIFFNKDLEEIPFDNKDWTYNKIELSNGILTSIATRYPDMMGCRIVGTLEICECNNLDNEELLSKHKEELETMKDMVLSGTVKLTYDGKTIKSEFIDQETVYTIYGKDVEGTQSNYCVRTN